MSETPDLPPPDPSIPDPPSVDELIADTEVDLSDGASSRYDDELFYSEQFAASTADLERAWVHLKGLQDHYGQKKIWSWNLMMLLAGMVLFQWILLGCVGMGWWDFRDYEWLLPILLVQNLGQIIGLALVVVKSLFKDMQA